MSTTERIAKDAAGAYDADFAGDLDSLKSSFNQLRSDVTSLLASAADAGKSGATAMRSGASDMVDGLKDKGAESLEAVESQIGEHPLSSTLIAFGVGFVLAKVLSRR